MSAARYGRRVSLVAAAVCPHPPLIVPEIAGAAAPELDELRAACDAAVARLVSAGARTIVMVGADHRTRQLDGPYRGSFASWGAPIEVTAGQSAHGDADQPAHLGGGTDRLPLSLLVGTWLLNRSARLSSRLVTVGRDEPAERCRQLGARLGAAEPWALLVMGDGSACRGEKSPGYDDPRAEPYDDSVAAALAGADSAALLDLDPGLSAELKVAGRAPWQVLAGAASASGTGWRGDLTYYAAPYGVAYFVATWTPA